MKARNIVIVVLLLVAHASSYAQDKLIEKYMEEDNVTSVVISKKMFQLVGLNMDTNGLALDGKADKVEGMQILTTSDSAQAAAMNSDFTKLANEGFEELMRVKDGTTRATFYIQQEGDLITDLIMLVNDDEEFTVIRLVGQFTIEDIQEITSDMD